MPFAEAPVGEQRFRPPRLKKPWNQTLDATVFSPACMQVVYPLFSGKRRFSGSGQLQHDLLGLRDVECQHPGQRGLPLYEYMGPGRRLVGLSPISPHSYNYYSNLTVMVWLFGGGYYSGSPSLILYDGRVSCPFPILDLFTIGTGIEWQCGRSEHKLPGRAVRLPVHGRRGGAGEHGHARPADGPLLDQRQYLLLWRQPVEDHSFRRKCRSLEYCRPLDCPRITRVRIDGAGRIATNSDCSATVSSSRAVWTTSGRWTHPNEPWRRALGWPSWSAATGRQPRRPSSA